MAQLKTIHSLNSNTFKWVNVTRVTEEETRYLEKTYDFHPLDIKDCLPPLQRSKIIPRDGYLFLILIFPIFNSRTKEIEPEEVDFFVKKDLVITAHNNKLLALQNFFELLEVNKAHCENLMQSPAYFLAQLIDELFDACFPMLVHISNDIESLRKKVLKGYSKETIHEILRLKNNIVSFRKAMQPHRDLMFRLRNLISTHFPIDKHEHYFQRLTDHCREIWDNLETYNYAIDALHQTHTTLISFRLNEIMRTLTVFSIIIFSLTLTAALFSMNTKSTPILGIAHDFWFIIALMAIGAGFAVTIFKRKNWL